MTFLNLQNFLASLKYDVFLSVLPIAGTTATAIASNPSSINVAAQIAKFQVDVLAAVPTLEQQAATLLAQLVNDEIQKVLVAAKPA
jgi:hypothetical protein